MTAHRRAAALMAALVATTALIVVGAPAARAQSYTCPEYGAQTIELNDGSASATIYVSKDCSDGRSRFSGVVRDIHCDARGARLWMRFFNGDHLFPYRAEEPSASNGCGSESTFSYSSTNPSPGMHACVRAQNWGPTESAGDCAW
ncbi:MAG TPA: hypothetical protein VFZ93_06160, partial [Albitalea sp.]